MPMPLVVLSILIIVVSNVLYHVSQKSIPGETHPLIALLVTYAVAILVTAALLPFFPVKGPLGPAFRRVNWASFALGVTVVGIEIGFLLAYRSGWRISLGSAVSNATVALVLIPIGLVFFGERLSAVNVVGVALCVSGLLLVVAR
jgi:drug/metabolite transporter (DMT)-like permease